MSLLAAGCVPQPAILAAGKEPRRSASTSRKSKHRKRGRRCSSDGSTDMELYSIPEGIDENHEDCRLRSLLKLPHGALNAAFHSPLSAGLYGGILSSGLVAASTLERSSGDRRLDRPCAPTLRDSLLAYG